MTITMAISSQRRMIDKLIKDDLISNTDRTLSGTSQPAATFSIARMVMVLDTIRV